MKKNKILKIILLIILVVVLILFLSSSKEEDLTTNNNEKQKENIVLELNNEEEIILEVNDDYIEYGVIATNNGVDISDKTKIFSSEVNSEKTGTYYVTYEITDKYGNKSEVKRKVIVVDTIKPELVLKGNNEISVVEKQEYKELGAIVNDNYDKDINSKIKIEGKVNTSKIGKYIITYSITDSSGNSNSITRTVKVIERGNPIISLKGTGTVYLELGTTYVESGYKAGCLIDGDLTSKVQVNGEVNINVIGTYTKTYTVTNSGNKTNTVKRTIIVRDTSKPIATILYSTKDYTKNDVTVAISVNEKIKNINGWNKIDDLTYEKTFKNNNNETIKIEDLNGNTITINVIVANIDKDPPVVTYTTTTDNLPYSTLITVIASDNVSGVKEIKRPDNTIISSSTATFQVHLNGSYTFKIVDNFGNESKLIVNVNNVQTEEIMVESDGTRVNRPKLASGMIPIKYNGTNWVVTNIYDFEWSDYKTQMNSVDGRSSKWGNVMLSDGTYKADTVKAGQIINENELGSMFVWIPRFAYKIESSFHLSTTGTINIEFLDTNTDSFLNHNGSSSRNHEFIGNSMINFITHPVFTNESTNNYANGGWDSEITGFWTAKFEARKNDSTIDQEGINSVIKIVPNVVSWRTISINDIFLAAFNMKDNNSYGVDPIKIDTHLMKNSEWGAIAYLSHSKYGLLASSTGNIYGVYDLSGGAYEYIAGYLDSGHADLIKYGNYLVLSHGKYKNKYNKTTLTDNSANNYNQNSNKFGDAIYETSSAGTGSSAWNGDYTTYPAASKGFIIRGANAQFTTFAGIFSFVNDSGAAYRLDGFRPVIYNE